MYKKNLKKKKWLFLRENKKFVLELSSQYFQNVDQHPILGFLYDHFSLVRLSGLIVNSSTDIRTQASSKDHSQRAGSKFKMFLLSFRVFFFFKGDGIAGQVKKLIKWKPTRNIFFRLQPFTLKKDLKLLKKLSIDKFYENHTSTWSLLW